MARSNNTRTRGHRDAADDTSAEMNAPDDGKDGRSSATDRTGDGSEVESLDFDEDDAPPPDLKELTTELAGATSMIRVAQRSLNARPEADVMPEYLLLQEVLLRLARLTEGLEHFERLVSRGGPAEASPKLGTSPQALVQKLRSIDRRLELALSICMTADLALRRQDCEHDREVANCLRWGVADAIWQQQCHLRFACKRLGANEAFDDPDVDVEADSPAMPDGNGNNTTAHDGGPISGTSERNP